MPPSKRRRRQPGKVDQLPAPLREGVARLWESGRYTLEQIAGFLGDLAAGKRSMLPAELDVAVSIPPEAVPSKSSLGRHVQGLSAIAEKLQRSRAVAEALVEKLGDAPESRAAALNIELMHTVILDLIMAAEDAKGRQGDDGAPVPMVLDPEQAMFLGRCLKDLAGARKTDADLTMTLRRELAKEMAAKLDEEAAVNKGLNADTVAALKSRFLGIKPT